jgi:hypothetical protein
MVERLPGERGKIRKAANEIFFVASLVTFPVGIYTAGTAFLGGEMLKAAGASAFAFFDRIQILEHGKHPREQKWYNPERLTDRAIGFLRFFRTPSTRIAVAARA